MSSHNTAATQASQGQEEEKQGDTPPRGRTQVADASTGQEGSGQRNTSRSVSRGRTHARLPPKVRRGRDPGFTTEGFVYPGLGGSFVPRDRRVTISEGSYHSDPPHIDPSTSYHPPQRRKRRASGAVKSPSHIRFEIEAMAEAAEIRRETELRAKEAEKKAQNLKE
ncbi:hypothetical protein KVR01_006920 [Diaporthe batatas]|uniref:uncharacterized protein n=1 Tax=Diaporthe batatas TaxID=748121 RepID=UPI001D055446|nr:uncharacterized protein KVR01_006920 [Diaporthe batatas]KAG8163623.1 hypothetical protein KVR01_006920 [Diaporthe batatas]